MSLSLPFIALWNEVKTDAGSVLHILSKDVHHSTTLPKIRTNATAVEEFLPEIVHFSSTLKAQGRWLLLLEPGLPESWQNMTWESLNLAGKSIGSQALVIRSAKWMAAEASSIKKTKLLNLFPRSEFSFDSHLEHAFRSGVIRRSVLAFVKNDMASASDLIITAHGNQLGLLDADGDVIDIPIAHPMPERIWLLACNVNGGMYILAQRLIDSGCRSVITATTDLSAPQMAQLVKAIYEPHIDDGDPWLIRFVETLGSSAAGIGLTVWGSVDLDTSTSSEWNSVAWDKIHDKTTVASLNEQTSREDFTAARDIALSSQTWPITRTWMMPPLLWLAELHDHPSMLRLAKVVGDSTAPEVVRGLAAIARRTGDYVQTAKFLSITLALPELPIEERANSLGQLANLFIDMNLPECALKAIALHEDCNLCSLSQRDEANFRRLDWIARAQARRGKFEIALDYMTTKRKRALVDSGRELAWQLYISVWGYQAGQIPLQRANAYAIEAAEQLTKLSPTKVRFGNECAAYLLRSLAAHSWASDETMHIPLINKWLVYAESRLTDDDPGPWAYAIVFIFLRTKASDSMCERAIEALQRCNYLFEAATLAGLAGLKTAKHSLLSRFQTRRTNILKSSNFSQYFSAEDIDSELGTRTYIENSILSKGEEYAVKGLFPL